MKYNNLKNKTIFDITTDNKILNEVLPYVPKDVSKEQYYAGFYQNSTNLALAFLEIADLTNDDELRKATESQFATEINKYFNE